MDHFFQDLPGWFNDCFREVYRAAVANAPPEASFVEVGSWMGQSAAFMAVEIANSGKAIAFHCVDNWAGGPDDERIREFLACNDGEAMFRKNVGPVLDRITVRRGQSVEVARTFADSSLDFVFLDASHDYPSVKADITAWLPKIRPGGTLAGHDFDHGFLGVVHAVRDRFGDAIRVEGNCWIYEVPVFEVV